jgi:hypothetical protein
LIEWCQQHLDVMESVQLGLFDLLEVVIVGVPPETFQQVLVVWRLEGGDRVAHAEAYAKIIYLNKNNLSIRLRSNHLLLSLFVGVLEICVLFV